MRAAAVDAEPAGGGSKSISTPTFDGVSGRSIQRKARSSSGIGRVMLAASMR
jgi:hypothetical protein